MYLEHFHLKQSPFRQEPDPEIFFSGAGRRAVLHNLLEDLEAGKPLIKLTGSEGVGKTLLYLLLARKLSHEKYDLVCLDHPVGSFEDLLRIICIALGLETNGDTERRDYVADFHQHLQLQKEAQRKVLLIIDEAEKLFLATLERLVRMICDTEEAGILQILLIGRFDIDQNLDQLAIYCSNIDVNAGYTLEPLSFEETQKYLQFRLHVAGMPGDKHLSVFTDDAVSAIYQAAMGNISLTNMLAEKGLVDAYSQGMFQVEPELINPRYGDDKDFFHLFSQYGELFKQHKKWVISGAAILLVLLLVAIWPRQDEEHPETTYEEQVEVEKPVNEGFSLSEEDKDVEETNVQVVSEEIADRPLFEVTEKVTGAAEPEAEEQKTVQLEEEETDEIVVHSESKKKKSPVVQTRPDDDSETVSPRHLVTPVKDGEALFEERVRASSNWLAWAYRGGFTIQLMVLASENAEENLKRMLVEENYFSVKDNLYILRKISPPTLFVFYGLYDSIAEARLARNNMDVFLRKHHPYALSINTALKKTED